MTQPASSSSGPNNMLERYNTKNQGFRAGYTKVPYRERSKPSRKLTNAEKRDRSEAFSDKQKKKIGLLKKAHDVIWGEACELAKELGHTPEYWYEYLMHTESTPAAARATNRWCVYVSKRSKELNAGEYIFH